MRVYGVVAADAASRLGVQGTFGRRVGKVVDLAIFLSASRASSSAVRA
jgi:hypothetical protein